MNDVIAWFPMLCVSVAIVYKSWNNPQLTQMELFQQFGFWVLLAGVYGVIITVLLRGDNDLE